MLARVVRLKINIHNRPIVKVCSLPINEECGVGRPLRDVIVNPNSYKRKQEAQRSNNKKEQLMVTLPAF